MSVSSACDIEHAGSPVVACPAPSEPAGTESGLLSVFSYLRASMAVAMLLLASGARAVPLDPALFSSLGALPAGSFTLDTDPGGGGVIINQGVGLPDIAVFAYNGGSVLGALDTITVTGSNTLAILFKGSATISGAIDVSGGSGSGAFVGTGVAGGGNGGRAGPFGATDGVGTGGGGFGGSDGNGSGSRPGAGGGFGENGGGAFGGAAGGSAYGNLLTALEAGSGGGGGGGHCCSGYADGGGGGAGGGALEIGVLTLLDLSGAEIRANGGNGGDGERGGGGGSGGGLFFHGFDITLDSATLLSANGGNGGMPGPFRTGGCGGGGRIVLLNDEDGTLSNGGATLDVSGGEFDTEGGANCTGGQSLFTTAPPPMPEPGTLVLCSLGLAGLGFARRAAKKAAH